jgi:hypothetical protein
MGFWEKVFGSKSAEQADGKARILKLEELKALVEKKSEAWKKEFTGKSFEKFEGIERLLKEAMERIEEIKQKDFEAEGENTYLRKIVQSSKQGFTARMHALLEKNQPPKEKDFGKCLAYSSNAAIEFDREILSFQKNIAYTGILAKKEMIEIGKALEGLQKELSALQGLAKDQKASKAESLIAQLNELNELQSEKANGMEEVKSLKEMLEGLEKEKTSVLEKSKSLKEGNAFKEFDEKTREKEKLLEEKKALKEKAANLLMPLEKQLRKLQNLSESKNWILEKETERMLTAYLRDAFNALRQDPKGETLKEVLKELEKAVDAGKISFKDEKEKGKKIQEIEKLKGFDFFNEFFWKLNELDKKLSGIEAEIEKSTLFKDLNALQARIESIEREAMQKTRELEALKEKAGMRENAVMEKEKEIEAIAEGLLEEKIMLKLAEVKE